MDPFKKVTLKYLHYTSCTSIGAYAIDTRGAGRGGPEGGGGGWGGGGVHLWVNPSGDSHTGAKIDGEAVHYWWCSLM